MKKLPVLFGIVVAGIVACFGMTVYTAVKQRQIEKEMTPVSIPTPAIAN